MTLSVVQVIGNVAVGGAERHLLDLVLGLGERAVRAQVVCPRPGPLSQVLLQRGVPVRYLEMVLPRPGDEYGLRGAAVEQLARWLQAWQPDVVHSHLYPAHLHASLAAVEVGVPAIVHTAHTLVARPGDAVLGRLTPAHTIATSRAAAHALVAAGVPTERVEVIYNGVSRDHLTVEPADVRRVRADLGLGVGPVVGTVARLSHEKGVDVLLRALARVRERVPAVTALVVGDGPEHAPLRQLAAELGLAETVRFLGTRTDVPALNRVLDVFALPSREEACPLALLEAMAAGRAVVATGVGGTPELVAHGVNGWLVPTEDPAAMAAALVDLLQDAPRSAALGLAARTSVVGRFTRGCMVDATIAYYERILVTGATRAEGGPSVAGRGAPLGSSHRRSE